MPTPKTKTLIVDSGSTKADWAWLGADPVPAFTTRGVNPYFYDADEVQAILQEELPEEAQQAEVEEVFFYGAGCSSEMLNARIENGLQGIWPQARIHVHHDLLGAARAACQQEPGIAIILGTGSNACRYDGRTIEARHGGLGYILGDEGSGMFLGKQLVAAWMDGDLPQDLAQEFDHRYQFSRDEVNEAVYHRPNPNRYLASFGQFLGEHQQHQWVRNMVYQLFENFIVRHIRPLQQQPLLPVFAVGSVASHFRPLLEETLARHQFELKRVVSKPIQALVDYHEAL